MTGPVTCAPRIAVGARLAPAPAPNARLRPCLASKTSCYNCWLWMSTCGICGISVAVADELNFTRAAERLHLSQPALSKQIRSLEASLRAQLLRRDRRQVELTAAGQALHATARSLLADWDEAAAVVAAAAAAEAKTLRVGTLTSIGRGLFPAVLEEFGKRQPGWQGELRSFGWGDPTAGLAGQETDAAFLWLPVGAGLETEGLASEPRLVTVNSRHPPAGRAHG